MGVRTVIISQYRSALKMLDAAVEACPEPLWDRASDGNRTWHVAYHALFYTQLYLAASEEAFVPWEKARPNYNFMGPIPWPPHEKPKIEEAYRRDEIRDYCALVSENVAPQVRALPLDEPSGFSWLPFNRLELHVYNTRHLQHHTGQLIERLRQAGVAGIRWVGMSD